MYCAVCVVTCTLVTMDRQVRVCFAEHYRDSETMDVRTAWGSHYVDH